MNNLYIALITGVLFFAFKFLEKRFVKKEQPELKIMFRDSLLVAVSSVVGHFIYKEFSILVNNKATGTPTVFVNEPDF
jgi:hypothetical protein